MRYVLIAVCALLGAVRPALAERYGFRLEHDGTPTIGRVCFYKATSETEFFGKFAASNDVRCLPSDKLLTIPPGKWRFFAEADGLVAAHPEFLVLAGRPSPTAIRKVTMSLVPAGNLDTRRATAALHPGEYLAIYLSNEANANSPASMRPVRQDETRVLVPADMSLVAIVMKDGSPMLIGDPFMVNAGETFVLEPLTRVPGRVDVVAYVGAADPWNSHFENVRVAPEITLMTKDSAVAPAIPVRHGAEFERTLQIFKSVKPGPARLVLSGPLWTRDEIALDVSGEAAVALAPRKLIASPASAITIIWAYEGLRPEDLVSAEPCTSAGINKAPAVAEIEPIAPGTARVISCTPSTVAGAPPRCDVRGVHTLGRETSGTTAFTSLPPGQYAVEVRYGNLQPLTGEIDVPLARDIAVSLRTPASIVRGRVTRGDAPMQAELRFGRDRTVSSSTTGEYSVVLTSTNPVPIVDVRPCDDNLRAYSEIPTTPLTAGMLHDIEIPLNGIDVSVVDTSSGQSLSDAQIGYSVLTKPDSDMAFFGHTVRLGVVTPRPIGPFDTQHYIRVCASAVGYDEQCAPSFLLKRDERKPIDLKLSRTNTRRGKVMLARPITRGHIFWVDASGAVTESRGVLPDGSFTFKVAHAPTEYVVLVLSNYPLAVIPNTPVTASEDDVIRFSMPSAPVAMFTVQRRSQSAGRIPFTISVGRHIVPRVALSRHQFMNGLASAVEGGAPPLKVGPIYATDPISVILGPDPWPANLPEDIDVFVRPEFNARMMTQRVDQGSVVFP